jgi:hypothetical protein
MKILTTIKSNRHLTGGKSVFFVVWGVENQEMLGVFAVSLAPGR